MTEKVLNYKKSFINIIKNEVKDGKEKIFSKKKKN